MTSGGVWKGVIDHFNRDAVNVETTVLIMYEVEFKLDIPYSLIQIQSPVFALI